MRWLYTVLLYLLTPLVLLRLLWRSRALRDYRLRWNERFGFVAASAQPVAVWVHAVSVGESLAAMPLIRALVAEHGPGRVLVTTTTPTGVAVFAEDVAIRTEQSSVSVDGAVRHYLSAPTLALKVTSDKLSLPEIARLVPALDRVALEPAFADCRFLPTSGSHMLGAVATAISAVTSSRVHELQDTLTGIPFRMPRRSVS